MKSARHPWKREVTAPAGVERRNGLVDLPHAADGEIGEIVLGEAKARRDERGRRERGSQLRVRVLMEAVEIVRAPDGHGPSVVRPGLPAATYF